MKKSLFIASLIAAFALAACNKPAEQPAPETTDSAPGDSGNTSAAPDENQENQAAPALTEPAQTPEAPASDAEKSEETEPK